MITKAIKKIYTYGELVMFSHTLFSLPFAMVAFIVASGGTINVRILFWVLVCLFAGRNGANAINRYIDREIDAQNPRTSGRHIPSGEVKPFEALAITIFCYIVFVYGSLQINYLCFILSPVALLIFSLYSYTKRFTYLCHIILGIACAGAPMGVYIALKPEIFYSLFGALFSGHLGMGIIFSMILPVLTPVLLSASVALWVAGFDILYATQDIYHDREYGLFSIPAAFGEKNSRSIAFSMHMMMVLLLSLFGWMTPSFGWVYACGIIVMLILLIVEHRIREANFAAYNMNQIISITYFISCMLDFYFI